MIAAEPKPAVNAQPTKRLSASSILNVRVVSAKPAARRLPGASVSGRSSAAIVT